jgi:hypothetical protein
MTGVSSTGNFAELLWPGIAELWGFKYKNWNPLYEKFFTIKKSDKAFEKVQQVTGFPKAAIKEEGNEAYFAQMYQGYQKEFRHFTYSIGAAVTREMVEDDQYNVIEQIPKMLAKSMRETEEVVAHNVLNNAFSTSFPTADGSALCATHTLVNGSTLSNTLTTAADLTLTALESAVTQMMRFTDDQGLQIMVNPKKLIIPVEYSILGDKILESDYVTGSADNDVNVIKSRYGIELIATPYLTDTDGWFLASDIEQGLEFYRRRPAELDRDNDFATDNLKMKNTTRFSVGPVDFRCVIGTPGA